MRIAAIVATACGWICPGTSTKIVRTRPPPRVRTRRSRSAETARSSSRSSTAASSAGATATPSSCVSTLSTCAARRRMDPTVEPSAVRSSRMA